MDKAPVYETGECRFDPCRRRSSRRSSVDESTALRRRGSHVRIVPARRKHGKRSGWMRSLSRKQVGVVRPLGVRVAPLPLTCQLAAMVQWSRRRALNPETGVRLPVAVELTPMPGSRTARRPAVTRKVRVRVLPWQRNARWPRIQARGCKPRDEGEIPSRASIAHHVVVVQRRGSRCATPGMRVRLPPTTPTLKTHEQREEG